MTLSGTITTEMRFISIYTYCCAMDIDTSSTVTPKRQSLHLCPTPICNCCYCMYKSNKLRIVTKIPLYLKFKLIYHEPWHHIK